MAAPAIPKFNGRENPVWLNDFEIAMMDRSTKPDDANYTAYFKFSMLPDSPAEVWFETLPEATKTNGLLLREAWKSEFGTATTASSALDLFLDLKLKDDDIGRPQGGVPVHVTLAEAAAGHAARIPTKDMAEHVKSRTIISNVGPLLRGFLRGRAVDQKSPKELLRTIKDLSPTDIHSILLPLQQNRRIAELENQSRRIADLENRLRANKPTGPPAARQPMQEAVAPQQDNLRAPQPWNRPRSLPHPNHTPEHIAEIDKWFKQHRTDFLPPICHLFATM
jgi:hypothetical protein